MPEKEQEAVVKEFQVVQEKYVELFEKLVKLGIPGVIDAKAAKCSVGEVCHGGTFHRPIDLGMPIEQRK